MISKKILTIAGIALTTVAITSVIIFTAVNNNNSREVTTSTSIPTPPTSTSQDVKKHLVTFDTNGGTPISPIEVVHGSFINRPTDPIRLGYTATTWEYNSTVWDFSLNPVVSDMVLVLNWDINVYKIDYRLNGGIPPSSGYKTTYTVNDSFELMKPTKTYNVFAGWFDLQSKRLESISKGTTGDLVLDARWIDNLTAISLDETRGNILVYGGEESSEIVTVVNNPVDKKCHTFMGWYDNDEIFDDEHLLSKDDSYTFTLKSNVMNYVYAKYMDDEQENVWNVEHCVIPEVSEKYVRYGLYPQSVVDDDSLADVLNTLEPSKYDGYYHYRGEYYCKQISIPNKDINGEILEPHIFDNGEEIVFGETYWFKLEPINWKILSESSDKLILSEKLLSVKQYDDASSKTADAYPNNYKNSDIREWLNDDFYTSAFAFNNEYINMVEVDNSAATTNRDDNIYACENTFDNVFLLSYNDYLNPDYGFDNSGTSSKRIAKTTDYCRAQGATYGIDSNDYMCGYYWTRSPYYDPTLDNGYLVSRCNKNGTLNLDAMMVSHSSVRPAISVAL